MKKFTADLLAAAFFGLILPSLLVQAAAVLLPQSAAPAIAATETTAPTQPSPVRVSLPVQIRDPSGQVLTQDLDTYLIGVVLAEMPADFEAEALKAQAVAARTYARKAGDTGGKHGDGSICTQSTCCQAYIAPEDYLSQGGTPQGLDAVTQAVLDTSGLVLTYDGALIEATYFSCSGGRTEDAVAVWGADFPYLQAVDSPGEEKALHYQDQFTFSPEQFAQALGISPDGDAASWFQNVQFTSGGGIASMDIAGQPFTGVQLRKALGLPSTRFSIQADSTDIHITTSGYGHRVGMSQYGADAMALTGSTFRQILAHYYPGTQLTLLEQES